MIEYWQCDRKAERIHQLVVEMGDQAAGMLSGALKCLAGSDQAAAAVLRAGAETNDIHQMILADCAHYVAGTSPIVKDLRFIVTSLQISTDLERIADQAVEVALAGRQLAAAAVDWPIASLKDLGGQVEQRVRDTLHAFAAENVSLARQYSRVDSRMETVYRHLMEVVTHGICEHPEQAHVGVRIIEVIQTLNHIVHHALSIARWVVVTETGERPRRLH